MKTETIAEFLARGGKITVVEPVQIGEAKNTLQASPPKHSDLMSLSDGQFYFAQRSKRRKKGETEDAEE